MNRKPGPINLLPGIFQVQNNVVLLFYLDVIVIVLVKEVHVILVQIQKLTTEVFPIPVARCQEHLLLLVSEVRDIHQGGKDLPEEETPLQENIEKKGIVVLK